MSKIKSGQVHAIARFSDVKECIPKDGAIKIGYENDFVVATGSYALIQGIAPDFLAAAVTVIQVNSKSPEAVSKFIAQAASV